MYIPQKYFIDKQNTNLKNTLLVKKKKLIIFDTLGSHNFVTIAISKITDHRNEIYSVVSDSLQPHGLQPAMLFCP